MTNALPNGLTDCLLWSEELGMGFHPRKPMSYEGDYWNHYREMDATDMGAALTQARVELVRRHYAGAVVDIGIGGGRFVSEADSYGFDVSASAIAWLKCSGRYLNPYEGCVAALCCWDSLEHVPDPVALVACASQWLFVSMPIYHDVNHCLASKHYKPGEHLWYWTEKGFIDWCAREGFELVEKNHIETAIGREGITSFAFRRVQ
ncbi:MAG TPA: methyltransferase domain-containing protein [Cellvibrio sp.]|nr:methyltransferase domain-containing protein [Cellvibrio sp.]